MSSHVIERRKQLSLCNFLEQRSRWHLSEYKPLWLDLWTTNRNVYARTQVLESTNLFKTSLNSMHWIYLAETRLAGLLTGSALHISTLTMPPIQFAEEYSQPSPLNHLSLPSSSTEPTKLVLQGHCHRGWRTDKCPHDGPNCKSCHVRIGITVYL